MAGSQVKGKSFRGALRYNQEKVAAAKLNSSIIHL